MANGKGRSKTWFITFFVTCFLILWLSGMVAGLTAGACRNDRYDGLRKLRYCQISLLAGGWFDAFEIERAKRAVIHLHSGIALAQLGRDGEARASFETAIEYAGGRQGPWLDGLHDEMSGRRTSPEFAAWTSVVTER